MTTFEHALLGINGALSVSLHRHFGWPIVAVAGVAAIVPDWDGLSFLFDINTFDAGHRVWGHNVFVCVLLGVIVGVVDYRFDWVTHVARFTLQRVPLKDVPQHLETRQRFSRVGYLTWITVAVLAMCSHLLADVIVSGTAELPDWELKVMWPLSDRGWVYPLVSWGDPAIAIVFVVGMFAMLRWKTHVQTIACLTLGAVAVYISAQIPFVAR